MRWGRVGSREVGEKVFFFCIKICVCYRFWVVQVGLGGDDLPLA